MNSERISFNKNGFLSRNISAFFDAELKDIMQSADSSTEDCWTYIFKNSTEQKDLPYLSARTEVEDIYLKCFEDYCDGKFSFFFRRLLSESRENAVSCTAAKIAFDFCDSEKFKSRIADYTGREIGKIDLFYINRFDKGHFLNTHTDSGNNVGIALNITQDWDPNFGGLTHILDETRNKVIETLTPGFGELFLFDTSQTQIPHFVSMVTANPKKRRMSVIARYGKI